MPQNQGEFACFLLSELVVHTHTWKEIGSRELKHAFDKILYVGKSWFVDSFGGMSKPS